MEDSLNDSKKVGGGCLSWYSIEAASTLQEIDTEKRRFDQLRFPEHTFGADDAFAPAE
jgi:hypothetical protein